ncbi:MAG TPA: V-type ATP synthase subunit F [Holophaga sp.]|jgi:vacuolar-type H+-ATPase subunit F/Vma7|nr:V-type ATP synthase subunit F [Holophaga sp.]
MPTPVSVQGEPRHPGATSAGRVYCLGDEDTVRGFRLAGVSGRTVLCPGEGADALGGGLAWALAQPDCDLLVLTEEVAAALGARMEALRNERTRPLIVEIPGPAGPRPGRENLRQLVQRAVGSRLEQGP